MKGLYVPFRPFPDLINSASGSATYNDENVAESFEFGRIFIDHGEACATSWFDQYAVIGKKTFAGGQCALV